MIPSDLAARLRLLTEASFFSNEQANSVQQLTRVQAIQSQFPDLSPGTRFTALLERPLPDGSFRAVVAGRSMTLSLNQAANAGDTLELVVTRNTPAAIFAQLADGGEALPQGLTDTALSQTGKLINTLLTGQTESKPLQLADGRPLIASAPGQAEGSEQGRSMAATLAPQLQRAVTQSGLFYEAHLARWLAGKVSTEQLAAEPQGRVAGMPGGMTSGPMPGAPAQPPPAQLPVAPGHEPAGPADIRNRQPVEEGAAVLRRPAGSEAADEALRPAETRAAAAAEQARSAGPIPERLLPTVQQQLDSLATNQVLLHGQAWPGQHFQLEIEYPRRDGERGGGDEEAVEWNTTLRLQLPEMGGIEAHLVLTPAGVALRIDTDSADSARAMEASRDELASALEAGGLALSGMVIQWKPVHE